MRSFYRRVLSVAVGTALLLAAMATPGGAQSPITPITAEQAFDAVRMQQDPATGLPRTVVLVDIRTRAEYYWVGTAARVTTIELKNGGPVVPDLGKVKLEHNGMFITYHVNGNYKRMLVQKVAKLNMAPIAYSVPYQLWDEATRSLSLNADFGNQIARLAGTPKPVLILFCRSGGRTDAGNCIDTGHLDPDLFAAIYEIDQPDGTTNHGGMEGSNYANVYNGYRGFPERDTWNQAHPSVSWKDAGLPIVIGATPPALPPAPAPTIR